MIWGFSNYSSIISFLYTTVVQMFSYYYLLVATCILGVFLMYRFPYCYSPLFFVVFLLTIVFSSFMSLFLRRIFNDYQTFFAGFIPVGTPIYICPVVCIAETISYLIRPFVLIFRPFINIGLGCAGAAALGNLFMVNSVWMLVLCFLFFYELFVALVHWFIVSNILAFSVDH
uniref:ATP synthase F0 subunit 6 n=1 Tax=Rhodobothrium cf. paucitesticulare DJM-2021 TaxID=2899513 RepID=A0A8K1W587_9CEST|nr:ATP synthase F0 subunit 6 [Rhodobothrium cf. paucitesticulare DJM-2021]UFQ89118.1 ATP synthase F0 subunit 6 [Rhodobothrium cf. paucitesticulare DJM-2021]